MTELIVFKICIPHTKKDYFDYRAEDVTPVMGARVLVPFGKQKRIGVVLGSGSSLLQQEKIKSILAVLDDSSLLPPDMLTLCHWVSRYYQAPLSEVIPLVLPKQYRQLKTRKASIHHEAPESKTEQGGGAACVLNEEQQTAVTRILTSLQTYRCFLLYGITGSGKTEVYLHVIERVLQAGQQVLILVPEIGLTPQLLAQFQARFQVPIAVLHSSLSDGERQKTWQLARENQVKLLIGTRTAVFTPMPALGLIVVDEEHDLSFKQMEGIRYHARDTALIRARDRNIPVILGTATPSLESLYNALGGKYDLLRLTRKAKALHPLYYRVIDLRHQALQHGLAETTLQTIQAHLEQHNQVLVFLNRRGFAPVLLCHQCGFIADCSACDSHLTLHRKAAKMMCHHCGESQKIPHVCKSCGGEELIPVGAGTQRVHEFLAERFPETVLLRMDRDTVRRKKAWDEGLGKINNQEAQLIIGTQMLAKGHHFPRLTLVVILDIDQGFYNHDFRALERVGQLLTQVTGRAGRAEYAGEIVIQTHLPQHPLLSMLIQQGYDPFTEALLEIREKVEFPPYHFMALIRAQGKTEAHVLQFLHTLKNYLQHHKVVLAGPAPSPLPRKSNFYRMQLLCKSASRKNLHHALTAMRGWLTMNPPRQTAVRWSVDVDPQDLS